MGENRQVLFFFYVFGVKCSS